MKKNIAYPLSNNIVIGLIPIIMLMSCNSVKRVMRDQEKFDYVGKEWVKKNPLDIKHDTTYVAGKPYLKKVLVRDTIKTQVPCDDFKAKTDQGSNVTVKSGKLTIDGTKDSEVRVDTAKFQVENLTRIKLLNNDLDACAIEKQKKDATIKAQAETIKNKDAEIKNLKTRIILMWVGFALLIGAAIFLKVKKIFSWF
jgi:hypothetical protein